LQNPENLYTLEKNRKFLPQLLLKLVASAITALCTPLMSKNVDILSNGVGRRRDVCKCLHSHKTIFLPQSFLQYSSVQHGIITAPNCCVGKVVNATSHTNEMRLGPLELWPVVTVPDDI